jgi:hypothetical protein
VPPPAVLPDPELGTEPSDEPPPALPATPRATRAARPAPDTRPLTAPPATEVDDESRLVARAFRHLRNEGDATSALAALDERDRRFGAGTLASEAGLARAEALLLLGRTADALPILLALRDAPAGLTPEVRAVRAELLARAKRCGEAVADFDALLAPGGPTATRERALYGRAGCKGPARPTRRPISPATWRSSRAAASRSRCAKRWKSCAACNVPGRARHERDMTGKLTTLAVALSLAALGCGARTLIGEVDGGPSDDAGVGSVDAHGDAATPDLGGANSGGTCTPVQHLGDQPFTFPPGVAGVWTGFVQGGTSGLNSDAIKLVLDQAADGSSQIHVIYGAAAPPPPATSATELYPPGWAYMQIATMTLFEGFPYLAHNVRWQQFGQQWRLTFSIAPFQGWESWCKLQTSYPVDQQGHYSCVPGSAIQYENAGQADERCVVIDAPGGPAQVPCAQAHLCDSTHCTCDACGCAESAYGSGVADLLFDGDAASGGNVHLMRAAN